MSIRIIAKGSKVFKEENGVEVEIHGDEKAFYVKEMDKIDRGEDRGHRITNAHRDYCQCSLCVQG